MKKRLLAAIMSLCMIVSLLPVSALAYEGDEEPAVQSRDDGYSAYFYVRFPSDGTEGDTHAQNLFTFAGTGSVSGVEAPNNYTGENKVVGVTDDIALNPPAGGGDETHNQIIVSQFPDISYDTKTYVYEGKAAEADLYTYTVKWYRLVSERGYNIIQDGTSYSFSVSENDGYCWHVDGFIQFQDRHSVTYKVQFPGETGFSDVTANGEKETENVPYVDYLDEDKTFGDAAAPSMDETTEHQGETYTFKGWYEDKDCTQKIGEEEVITENITVYGKYEAAEPEGASVYFYVLLPGQESAATGDAADYRYLTYGGHVDETLAEGLKTSDPVIDQANEEMITKYLAAWPDKLLQYPEGTTPGKDTVASEPIEAGPTWEINEETGDVTEFSIVIDGETYTNVDWDIRWVKIGYVDIANSTVPSDHGYHVDAMLYKKTLAEEVINDADGVAKDLTNDQLSLGENGTENESETFKFVLDAKDDVQNTFENIPLKVTFDNSNKTTSLKLNFVNEDNAKRVLIPGTYVI